MSSLLLHPNCRTYTIVHCTIDRKRAIQDKSLTKNSKFGLAFQAAAEESGAAAKHDMFDTSIVEIGKDDLNAFIEALQIKAY
jgi:cell division control protein 45